MPDIFENKGAFGATIVVAASDSLKNRSANYVCDGTDDEVEIQAAFDALPAVGGTIAFLEGTYSIGAQINGTSNVHLIFLNCTFVGAFAGVLFDWGGATHHISSEGIVEFDGDSTATRALFFEGWYTVDKYVEWLAITTVSGFTTSGIGINYASHWHFGRIIGTNQPDALQNVGAAYVTVDDLVFLYTSNVAAMCTSLPGGTLPYASHLIFKRIFIDGGGVKTGVVMSIGNATVTDTFIEDVQILSLTIRNLAFADLHNFNVYRVKGLKISNFHLDRASLLIDAQDFSIVNGEVVRAPHHGIMLEDLVDVSACQNGELANIICKQCGQYHATGWMIAGIAFFGHAATFNVENISLVNVHCFDDQDDMTEDLASDAGAGQPDVVLDSLLGDGTFWWVGQRVLIEDDTPQQEVCEIASIDTATDTLTMVGNLANAYTVLQNARITGINTQDYGLYIDSYVDNIKIGSGCNLLGNAVQAIETNNAQGVFPTNIIGNLQAMSIALDLTGGATDIEVFYANVPCQIVEYTILYNVATGAGAGVNIRVGRYQDGVALDDDYFDVSVSELNKAKGYSIHLHLDDLTQSIIAAGDTVTVGTAGAKADTGAVILTLKIVELAD